jgi:hypothetical protein
VPFTDRCPSTPREGWRASGKTLLQLKDRPIDHTDVVSWKWTRGQRTDLDDFGDPSTGTRYALCAYDLERHSESRHRRRDRARRRFLHRPPLFASHVVGFHLRESDTAR